MLPTQRTIISILAFVCVLGAVAAGVWYSVPSLLSMVSAPASSGPTFRDISSSVRGHSVGIGGAPVLGSAQAKVAVLEYSDFQCPFCGEFARQNEKAITERYVTSGKVLWVFKHLPLTSIHPMAQGAAVAAQCAEDQGRFWQMHDLLFAHQDDLAPAALNSFAGKVGLDLERFTACQNGDSAQRIATQVDEARSLKVVSTPSFLLGELDSTGSVTVRVGIAGAASVADLSDILDDLLRSL